MNVEKCFLEKKAPPLGAAGVALKGLLRRQKENESSPAYDRNDQG